MNVILLVLAIYLLLMFGIAWYFSRRESLQAYFLNSRRSGLWLLTFSSVATMIGAGATVAIVSETYNTGISYGIAIPISLALGALILGIFAKAIKKIGTDYDAHTLVDFFEKRFDTKNKVLATFLQLLLMIVVLAVQAVAIASLATVLTGIEYKSALFMAAVVTILYTTIGGLKIDLITDFIQFWIITIVFTIMAFLSYSKVGGIGNLITSLPVGHLDLFAFGGVSWFVGVVLFSGFLYMGSTVHWQRIFSARSEKIARKSFFIAIPIMLLLGLIILFLGLSSTVLLSGIEQDRAIFSLMDLILPPWLVGVGFAAILAVIMSSVDSILIGGSTIIYRSLFRKNQFKKRKEMFLARLITALFGILGFSVAFMIPDIVDLSLFYAYGAVLFVPVVIAGILSKKISANASFYALLPTFILFVILFMIIGRLNSGIFFIPFLLSIFIVLFYDKIFKKRKI